MQKIYHPDDSSKCSDSTHLTSLNSSRMDFSIQFYYYFFHAVSRSGSTSCPLSPLMTVSGYHSRRRAPSNKCAIGRDWWWYSTPEIAGCYENIKISTRALLKQKNKKNKLSLPHIQEVFSLKPGLVPCVWFPWMIMLSLGHPKIVVYNFWCFLKKTWGTVIKKYFKKTF